MSTASRTFIRQTVPLSRSTALRGPRTGAQLKAGLRHKQQVRFNATQPAGQPGLNQGLVGGLIGGGTVVLLGYGYYHYSGVKGMVDTVSSSKTYLQSVTKSLSEKAPEPNAALDWLHDQALALASIVPGGKAYVDTAFKDVESIRAKHGDEVNKIVQDAYNQIKKTGNEKGVSLEGAAKSWDIIQDAVKKIGELAGDAVEDILNNHPELKDTVGKNLDQLKAMGDQYGPQAKEQYEDVKKQIGNIVKGGVSFETVRKIKQLVQQKSEEFKKFSDEAWKKGLEQAKPYLDKNPKIKELLEKNQDILKSGNLTELWDKVKSGNTEDIQSYLNSAIQSSSSQLKSSGLDKYLSMIPGAQDVTEKFGKLQEIGEKHGKEAEKLVKDTIKEVEELLKRKVEEGEKLAEKAKKDAKK